MVKLKTAASLTWENVTWGFLKFLLFSPQLRVMAVSLTVIYIPQNESCFQIQRHTAVQTYKVFQVLKVAVR